MAFPDKMAIVRETIVFPEKVNCSVGTVYSNLIEAALLPVIACIGMDSSLVKIPVRCLALP